jgi:hypothetical protein
MKSGFCKYYQPLRLEKPSNFRLEECAERSVRGLKLPVKAINTRTDT